MASGSHSDRPVERAARRRTAAARLALLAVLFLPLAVPAFAAYRTPSPRIARLEDWLKAVLRHQPGSVDASVTDVGSWSEQDLQTLWVDLNVFTQLMQNPRMAHFTVQPDGSKPREIRYTADDLRRLRTLACAAAGRTSDSSCAGVDALEEAGLGELASRAMTARLQGDASDVLRRGALLHTDIAILTSSAGAPIAPDSSAGPQSVRLRTDDGRGAELSQAPADWEIARLLLDREAHPGRDSMVRDWYVATAAWMQAHEQHDTVHLDHARATFPNDAEILFLSACQHETYASDSVQATVKSSRLPPGYSLDVGSVRNELRQAESLFRRALAAKAAMPEAHLRDGRVLGLLGRHEEAIEEARTALASLPAADLQLRYYGELFLGADAEALGRPDDARAAYERAAGLFPSAQSPLFALSQLARRTGDRAGALAALQRVFALSRSPARDDPWWAYHRAQGRDADERLDALRRPFLTVAPR